MLVLVNYRNDDETQMGAQVVVAVVSWGTKLRCCVEQWRSLRGRASYHDELRYVFCKHNKMPEDEYIKASQHMETVTHAEDMLDNVERRM